MTDTMLLVSGFLLVIGALGLCFSPLKPTFFEKAFAILAAVGLVGIMFGVGQVLADDARHRAMCTGDLKQAPTFEDSTRIILSKGCFR